MKKVSYATMGPEYEQPHGRTRYSVLGGADLAIYCEEAPAMRQPRPHYE